jgi:hypothetical protein
MMILQNPSSVGTSTIQSAYGAILSTQNKTASTAPTSAVSDYAVNPSASSPILSAFFQTLSQISNPSQASTLNTPNNAAASTIAAAAIPVASNAPSTNSAPNSNSNSTTNALQAFTYSLFQNLQASSSLTPAPATSSSTASGPNSGGLGPLANLTLGANTTYLNNLPSKLDTLSSKLNSNGLNTNTPTTLAGLQAAYQSLINSFNGDGSNSASLNSASLGAFLNQMSQNLQNQSITSIPKTGSLLDTKA